MKIGIVGATGEVGRMMINCLEELEIPVTKLRLFASANSAGKELNYNNKQILVEELTPKSMQEDFDYLLFSAGGNVSREYAPIAAKAGNTVIDNSSAFRQDTKIPLVIPEINAHILDGYQGIIANPNCSTIQMLLALAPIDKVSRVKKIIVSTYQSVSGSGNKGIKTLLDQQKGDNKLGIYSKPIANNVLPEIGSYLKSGYTDEEEKMSFETHKILGRSDILISATTVRVPVIYGHSENIYIELENNVSLSEIEEALYKMPSVKYLKDEIITPCELGDSNYSYVCRLRYGVDKSSLTFWNVANNIRVGAATNAVRILKQLINNHR